MSSGNRIHSSITAPQPANKPGNPTKFDYLFFFIATHKDGTDSHGEIDIGLLAPITRQSYTAQRGAVMHLIKERLAFATGSNCPNPVISVALTNIIRLPL